MNMRFFLPCLAVVLVSACVKAPVYKGENYARVESSHAIVSVNGKEIDPAYSLELPAGDISLVALYPTYRYKYSCQFTWKAAPRTAYEITDQENKYPLTLYRWKRTNGLWAERLDPVDPVICTPEENQSGTEHQD